MNTSNNKKDDLDSMYIKKNIPTTTLLIILSIVFIVSFLINFSLKDSIKNATITLAESIGCPLYFKEMQISYLFPKIEIENSTILGKCIGIKDSNIDVEKLIIAPQLPGIFPPAISFQITIKTKYSQLNVVPRISLQGSSIRIEKSIIRLEELELIFKNIPPIYGKIDIDALIHFNGPQISKGDLRIKSMNLNMQEQNIMGLTVPALPINNIILTGTIEENKFTISKFVVGDDNSPIKSSMLGDILINTSDPQFSRINLAGELKFSQDFTTVLPINLFLPSNISSSNDFKLKITGDFSKPIIDAI